MSLFDDFFDDPKKAEARRHHRKGRAAEDQVEMELRMGGFDQVDTVREGADFHAKKHDSLTGDVIEQKKVEVKSGNSRLTERQRREKEEAITTKSAEETPYSSNLHSLQTFQGLQLLQDTTLFKI